jgi:DNA-binding NarL/FixJ family response regulator
MTEAQEERQARVRETARLLASGLSHGQIAVQLGVHPRTVADYAAVIREAETKASRARRRKE